MIIFDPKYVFESALLLSVTNGLFVTGAGLFIAIYAALGFIRTGSFSMLMMGCGNLAFGLSAGIAGLVMGADGPNVNVTIYNIGAFAGGLLHLFGAMKTDVVCNTHSGQAYLSRRLLLAYLSTCCLAAAIATAAMADLLPLFFVQDQGPTQLRQLVLGCAISAYAVSALLLLQSPRLKNSGFLFWYSRGLLLMAVGLFANFSQTLVGSPLGWSGRIGNYLASIYLLISLLAIHKKAHQLDISFEKAVKKLFEEPARLYEGLVANIPDAVIACDQTGRILVWNAAAENLFGYSSKEAMGCSIAELIMREDKAHSKTHNIKPFGVVNDENIQGDLHPEEIFVRSKDGRAFNVEQIEFETEISGFKFSTYLLKDITHREKIESANLALEDQVRLHVERIEAANVALTKANVIAETANKAKTRFVATASHDIRQPLQSLNLLNSTLLKTIDDPKAHKMLDMQRESLDGMGRLLNSLLDISKLESGTVYPVNENFELQAILENLNAAFKAEANEKGLRLEFEVSDARVHTDSGLLSHVLHNLLANAIRYTEHGFVRVIAVGDLNQVRIEVSDSGIGIPEDELLTIFDEFHQVGRDLQQRHGGLGLGLSIVERVANMLGTKVTVHSRVGQGSTFSITIPAAKSNTAVKVISDVNNGQVVSQKGVVLLIDDDPNVLEATHMFFALEKGFEITTAASPPEAYAILENLKPDLIVTDLHLSHQDNGIDIIRVARKRTGRNIPAILISGDTGASMDKIDIKNLRIFSKPLNPGKLVSAAHQLIQASHS